MKRAAPLLVLVALAGCSGGSSTPSAPTIPPAKTFRLVGLAPSGPVKAGRTTVAFAVEQPSGQPLTNYRTGPGPHTGVHVIIVKDDLSVIIHRHPPIGANGRIEQPITFPSPGPYRVLADVYPKLSGPTQRNFQLTYEVKVAGKYRPQPLPPFRASQTVDGYHVLIHGRPKLRAIFPAFLKITVTDPQGKPVVFHPWYGALAHAIFFHASNLDYFHTHVCGPATPGCTSFLGSTRVTGSSTKPGVLRVGILLPEAGVWRLFLQFQANGKILTAPFTLKAAA